MTSVLILTAGRAGALIRCLDGLAGATRVPDETVVLLTRDDPETEEALKRHSLQSLRWDVWRPYEGGGSYAEARNALVIRAQGEKLAFLDDDCIPAPDWLERAEKALDRFDAIGGLVTPAQALRYPTWWDPEMGWLAGISVPRALVERTGAYCYPQAANLAIRRAALIAEPFQEVGGGFSSSTGDYATGREDAELWRRLRVKGYSTAFDAEMIVYHQIPQERLDYPTMMERARHDGAASVQRETNPIALDLAWRDVAYGPLLMLRRYLGCPWPNDPRRALDRLWLSRQQAVVDAWHSLNGQDHEKTWQSARKAAIHHVVKSELKRPIGKAILLLNKLMGPRREFAIPPRKMLVASAGFLGDAILTATVVNSWREQWPGVQVDAALASGSAVELLHDQHIYHSIWHVAAKPRNGAAKLSAVIDHGQYDVVVAPYFHDSIYPKTGHLFRTFGPPVIMFAQDNGLRRQSDIGRATLRLQRNLTRNELPALQDLFSLAGSIDKIWPWMPVFTEQEESEAERTLQQVNPAGLPLVALHPGTGRADKEWVWDRWFVLGAALSQRGLRVLYLCHPTLQLKIEQSCSHLGVNAAVLAGKDLRQMAIQLRESALLISPDTGPRHLASAMGAATVGIYGSTDERRWAPYFDPERHRNVRAVTYDLTAEELCPRPENYQCALVTVDQVLQAAMDLL